MSSVKSSLPPTELTYPQLSMWYALNNNWDKAHIIAQSLKNELGSWINVYPHRVEGDLENINYWYNRANKLPSQNTLEDEAEEIIHFIT